MDNHKLSKRIREERMMLGYKQIDMANKLSIASQTVNGWENGRRIPDANTLSLLADMFGCSVDYLIGRTDIRDAAVIEQMIGTDNVRIELNDEYYKSLSPNDVRDLLKQLKDVGFDLNKLL